MYVVFLSFALRLFIKLFSFDLNNWSCVSLKWFVQYYLLIFFFLKHTV
jgi:hypothetical protein